MYGPPPHAPPPQRPHAPVGGAPHAFPPHGGAPARPPAKRDPEATQRAVGKVLWAVGMLGGGWLLVKHFLLPPLFAGAWDIYGYMALGFAMATPPLVLYVFIPRMIDRFDPEPWWALLLCLSWGAVAACGFSADINTALEVAVGRATGDHELGSAFGACVSAPVFEELAKGVAVFLMFWAFRREFDGVVDGILYGTFVALGFAALENVVYYSNAARIESLQHQEGRLFGTFIMRGVLAPWGHPLYTSMTGLGFGIARETSRSWVRWLAPLGGYCTAVFLHSVWNTAATISNAAVLLMLPLWLLVVLGFGGMVLYLVRRKGQIIRKNLEDEILMGTITPAEVGLVTSTIGWWRASAWGGDPARRFIEAAGRLALSKWHAARATKSRKATVSADFVLPLRQDLHRLRAEMSRSLGRQLPQPVPWQPGMPAPFKLTK